MSRLRSFWVSTAVVAASLGVALSLLLGGALGTPAATGASASPADQATGLSASQIFGCRASVARVSVGGNALVEPAVANGVAANPGSAATDPCNDDSKGIQSTSLAPAPASVGPAGALTYETGALGSQSSPPGATAVTNINGINLTVGPFTLTAAGDFTSQVSEECIGTDLGAPTASSDLNALTISGPGIPGGSESINLDTGAAQLQSSLPAALGALISIRANETIQSPSNLTTQRMLDISLLNGTGSIVVGEAQVGVLGTGCAANTTPTTTVTTGANGTTTTVTTPGSTITVPVPSGSVPGGLQECTDGSTYDPSSGECVIYYNGQTIFVSLPFKGPEGGTAVPLPVARRYYRSPCLSGAGPNYAYLITKSHEKALGTYRADRILILGSHDNTDALAGNDCVDGIGTTQRITDGNGNDRDYVTKGTNRLLVGNGRDLATVRGGNNRVILGNGPNTVRGGSGRNWITDGDGNDHIYAGSQYNRIDAYGNEKHIVGGRTRDRIWTNSARAYISCHAHNKTIVFARQAGLRYAGRHGCQVLKILH